jgi:hypothetical protein
MKYQVHRVSEAEEELASIWIRAADRNLITQAAFAIDEVLRDNPNEAGESRSEGRRVFLHPPLGVTFSISTDDQTVLVLTVWRFDPRRKIP